MQVKVIAIDGPSGSGKSTIAKAIASELGITYLDTGALYRALAFILDRAGLDVNDTDGIEQMLESLTLRYCPTDDVLVEINGEDLSSVIREHKVSSLASKFAGIAVVRSFLKKFQRSYATQKFCILEGRDIGTVIFPDAPLKIFLTASSKVRATRRLEQLKALGQLEEGMNLHSIQKDIEKRDKADSERAIAPLAAAEDSIQIDTSEMTMDQVIKEIIKHTHNLELKS